LWITTFGIDAHIRYCYIQTISKGEHHMTIKQREELINLWEGGFDANMAAAMVGVTNDEAILVFAECEVREDDGDRPYFAAGARYDA
jgi:hypothetical protein